ncbi:SHOCT domain-containing protein [uncultured Aliiroseovarius sp.]|uniref:SHOCT domain-containing protein n=1 Tax=uncultured Aliiroseovarius sp. TaxID=1658783 RepID=UPI00259ACC5C|nr:SHOCT domain-containing protein [uncultured Aliiroseovarius sp.]
MKPKELILPALASLPASMAQADGQGFGTGHMWGGGYGFVGGFMMLAFWGAVIALIVFFVLRLRDNGGPPAEADAHETLRRRFANGEINEEEFRRLKATLDE